MSEHQWSMWLSNYHTRNSEISWSRMIFTDDMLSEIPYSSIGLQLPGCRLNIDIVVLCIGISIIIYDRMNVRRYNLEDVNYYTGELTSIYGEVTQICTDHISVAQIYARWVMKLYIHNLCFGFLTLRITVNYWLHTASKTNEMVSIHLWFTLKDCLTILQLIIIFES